MSPPPDRAAIPARDQPIPSFMHQLKPLAACLLLALFAPAARGATASFVMTDRTTQGNWTDTYGIPSFVIPGLVTNLSGSLTPGNAQLEVWAARTNLPGALLKPFAPGETNLTALDRHAAAWTAANSFSLLLQRASSLRRLSLYCLDVGSGGTRSQRIDLVDTNTGAILQDTVTGQPCSLTLSDFTNGVYAVWNVVGSVRINVTRLSGPSAAVSAVFLDNGTFPRNTNAPTLTQESVWLAPDLYFDTPGLAANEGDTFALGARTSGEAPMSFQWYRDGSAVANATSPTLTFTRATAAQGGNYTLVAANAYGMVTSRVATVNIYNPWSHHNAYGWLYDNRNGWFGNTTFGWLWFSSGWAYSSRLQGWLSASSSSTSIWSTQLRWITLSGNEDGLAYSSIFGWLWIGENGWVWNSRFGWVWSASDGTWFWSTTFGWLGVTPDGGIWCVDQGRFI
jgi:hypothetical protein